MSGGWLFNAAECSFGESSGMSARSRLEPPRAGEACLAGGVRRRGLRAFEGGE